MYAKAAPGDGKHDVQKQPNGEWQCTICKRPGFRNPKALRATTCFGPGLRAQEVQSRLKKEAAKARHLQEAEAARRHNAAVAAGRPGVRKHVLVPQGDTHRCEECALELPTMLRARNLERACPGPAPEGGAESSEDEFPPEQRHKLRQIATGRDGVWRCEICHRKEGRKRLKATRCWGPGAKTKSEILVLWNAARIREKRENERAEARAHNERVRETERGSLRHVPVPDTSAAAAAGEREAEVCETCRRRVVNSFCNRARFLAGVCPGPPQPAAPPPEEEAERQRRRRAEARTAPTHSTHCTGTGWGVGGENNLACRPSWGARGSGGWRPSGRRPGGVGTATWTGAATSGKRLPPARHGWRRRQASGAPASAETAAAGTASAAAEASREYVDCR